jgi:hypothetical protein
MFAAGCRGSRVAWGTAPTFMVPIVATCTGEGLAGLKARAYISGLCRRWDDSRGYFVARRVGAQARVPVLLQAGGVRPQSLMDCGG